MQAIILAGGKGTRLKPFTVNIPKPLMPIDDLPILEIVLRQLKHYGFNEIIITVGHLAELIMAFIGDGRKFGLNVTYSIEDKPLGTAGPLTLLADKLKDNFLVMNGDLLTTINYKKLFKFHTENNNDASICIYRKKIKIDLGVLKLRGTTFMNYIEKPTYYFDVSMGIYVFNKNILNNFKQDNKIDMPEMILSLKKAKKKILCYQDKYYWLDIGRIDDYEKAVNIFKKKKKEFLP